MDMAEMTISAKLGIGALSAALLGGGTQVLRNTVDVATLQEQNRALPEIRQEIGEVDDRLANIEKSLAVIAARAEAREDPE